MFVWVSVSVVFSFLYKTFADLFSVSPVCGKDLLYPAKILKKFVSADKEVFVLL